MTTLKCLVPVYIVMDGENINKVVVSDEELDLASAELVADGDGVNIKTGQVLAAAIEKAQECEAWPGWEFGW